MKTIKLTAEEIRILNIYLSTNPCTAGCALDHMPRLPKDSGGTYNCYAERLIDGKREYICPLKKGSVESFRKTRIGMKGENVK